MTEKPILSVVTPTLGTFSEYWIEQLLKVRGEVQFIFVYPPGATPQVPDDPRVKVLISPYKGEVMQRFVGLLNASGEFLIALDDDDFIHPDVAEMTFKYFQRFPESWVLKLFRNNINYLDRESIEKEWADIPDISQLEIDRKTEDNPYPFQRGNYKGLLEIPVAPLDTPSNVSYAIWPFAERKDMHGLHFENFNNMVWKTQIVQQALPDVSASMKLLGNITWLPAWNLDRLLGLFVQAKFYQKDLIIGHAPPKPEQIRYIERPANLKQIRFHLSSDALLVKRFPQYGYFWNLFFNLSWDGLRIVGKMARRRLSKLEPERGEK
ncbi:glycosyltransferase family A protein [Kamptonema formosum]|uniref:glycosyltransferase family A protein n=1 Tax=Kamptonema formosum TaxID=331992 RepID=UPI000349573F|nr:glycosyltransferase family A protein [Oscillatoria sp. PCC 10802]